jgi:hypothetical protein
MRWYRRQRGQDDPRVAAPGATFTEDGDLLLADCDDNDASTKRHLRRQGFRPGDGPPFQVGEVQAGPIDDGVEVETGWSSADTDADTDADDDTDVDTDTDDEPDPDPNDELVPGDVGEPSPHFESVEEAEPEPPEIESRDWLFAQDKEWQIAKLRELEVKGRSKLKTETARVDAILAALA